ncbi:MAG: hypothetical protein D6690_06445 [Nitrospirae bacterium]|nr:MAG: hypothetical protein D6690_06445 [Nitrospirota bacterium]
MKKAMLFVGLVIALAGLWMSTNQGSKGPKLPPNDPLAVEALTLVKTHAARQAPTIEAAIANILAELESRGVPYRNVGWRVAQEKPGLYVVSWLIREKGETGWIERDYAWRVDMQTKTIRVITLPATHLMPFHELPPLPHSQEIS